MVEIACNKRPFIKDFQELNISMLFSHIKVNFIALYRFLLFRHLALGLPSKNRVETLETRQLEISTCLDPNMSCKEFEIIKLKTNDEFIITYFSVACRVSCVA